MRVVAFSCVLVVLCLSAYPGTDGAKILGVFHPPAPSHFFCGSKLLKELAKRGHEVTMISSFPQKMPIKNYKDCPLTGVNEKLAVVTNNLRGAQEKSRLEQVMEFFNFGKMLTEGSLNNTNVQNLLKSSEKFDLIIMEAFLNEAHLGFAHHYNAPVVVLSTMGSNPWVNQFVGNPAPSSYVPEVILGYTGKMNFWQRMVNSLAGNVMQVGIDLVHLRGQDDIVQRYFPGAPHIKELFNKVAMVLLNSHISVSQAKPQVPSMVEIGGFHMDDVKALPKDLQEYLDAAKEGFMLFSLGSNIKSANLPKETLDAIMKAFAKLPYKILWKFEEPNLPGKPDNVRIDKWLPQNDILAHKNLKLFITHGGLLSTTEAIYHGVPVVGIPIIGDQKMNMANAVKMGIGKAVEIENLSEELLLEAVLEVLKNPDYRQNVRQRSVLMRDQPIKPIDSAVFWVEHVLRHNGAKHFRTGAMDLKWYELYLLDVWAFVIGGMSLLLFIGYKIIKCVRCSSTSKSKKE